MYSLRRYKKDKNTHFLYWLIVIVCIIFIIVNLLSNNLESDDIQNNIIAEESIEKAINDVVGISSNDGQNSSWGSGIIISKNGYILTNEHLISNENNCYVVLPKNETIKSNVVWSNASLDLAIVKVNKSFESCAIFLESANLKLGQKVYAIGNPIGVDFQRSVTTGIISGLNRNLEFEENGQKFYLTNLIQSDASINPGNSGGALINEAGQLIGINTIKISSAECMSFAIPIDIIEPIIEKLDSDGKFVEPSLGIWEYDKYSVQKLNLGINLESGIYIAQVDVDTESEKSGLRAGDIITKIDDKNIDTIFDFRKYIYEKNIGDNVKLEVKRDISNYSVIVKLNQKL
mgnify:CR=1 FL=1